ncbi:nitrogen regulation protein NR(I) [Temperatibacter marinus]|uniref:DNA-binding transcriptional regulator NtrC n=1 Tax=Temperatibacter marinus TaxID=1456591 RepID=A0AA52EET4_9PROT|nr:nitrogen regulation protein NR(I) [Temperatibacter marinus]WND02323.1 nitrogen regulation protein NR(I) [Temperatibacter marinus]
MRSEIIIADDDSAIRMVLEQAFTDEGWAVHEATNAKELKALVRSGVGDVAITDVLMPGGNGLDALAELVEEYPTLPFIVMSAQNTLSTAMESSKRGAFDYIPKPFDINELIASVKAALENASKHKQAREVTESVDGTTLIGRSAAMQSVYRVMARVVETDLTVLIEGQSGTGKELVARAMHDHSKRRKGPFIAINMAAVPRELIESELFGHEKGAFTGAAQKSIGRFGQAKGGTLFLDEIGDMPFEAQTRLLRVLQEGEYHSVGGTKLEKTDVRIIAATNKDLKVTVEEGKFREDLYFRLNVVPLQIPSLANRKDDIPDLVEYFNVKNFHLGLEKKVYLDSAFEALSVHNWPGNVRELENLIRRMAVLYPEDEISGTMIIEQLNIQGDGAHHQSDSQSQAGAFLNASADENIRVSIKRHLDRYFALQQEATVPIKGAYQYIINEVEIPLIEKVLTLTGGNQIKAADILGLNRNTLRKKIKELQIQIKK